MQLTIYRNAVKELAIPRLSAFLKDNADTQPEITGWAKMKAAEKRSALVDALKENKPLRELFVAFYAEETGTDADFSEWETADLPATSQEDHGFADQPAEGEASAPASAPAAVTGSASQFVEGAFDQIVADVAGLNAHDSDKNLREMEDKLEFEHLRMGVLLSHIQSSQHYVTLGYSNMREYLAAHTGLHYRKAMFLVSNANAIKELGIKGEELKGVSWSALRYIVQVMDKSNYKEWLDAARSLTHVALISEVSAAKAKAAGALPSPDDKKGAEKGTPKSKLFNLYPDQKATVEAAIEKAKAEGNVETTGAALDLIAASYTGKPPSDATVASVLPDLSEEGLLKMFTKLREAGGEQGEFTGLFAVLSAVDKVWNDVEINVNLPKQGGETPQAAE